MNAPACCRRHSTTCEHRGVCCTGCPTRREGLARLFLVALLLCAVLVLLAIALPA